VWRDVLKELCMDDQGLEICQVPEWEVKELTDIV
jgi:hypothetical protein